MGHDKQQKKGIILNDDSFLFGFGLTRRVGPRSPARQVCATKMTNCKGPI